MCLLRNRQTITLKYIHVAFVMFNGSIKVKVVFMERMLPGLSSGTRFTIGNIGSKLRHFNLQLAPGIKSFDCLEISPQERVELHFNVMPVG